MGKQLAFMVRDSTNEYAPPLIAQIDSGKTKTSSLLTYRYRMVQKMESYANVGPSNTRIFCEKINIQFA